MASVEKKEPHDGSSKSNPQDAHHPEAVYSSHPFPYNPTEGNPWAIADSPYRPPYNNNDAYFSPTHGYDTTSSDAAYNSPYMTMPDPAHYRYSPNPSTNGHEHEHEHEHAYAYASSQQHRPQPHSDPPEIQDHTDAGEQPFPPTVEPHDPSKLNDGTNVSDSAVKMKPPGKPNVNRLWLRLGQFVASAGAFGFLVGASPYSGESNPFDNNASVVPMYIVSVISIVVSLFYITKYFMRRCHRNEKMRRWIMILIDFALATAFGITLGVMIGVFNCKPGERWCDFYNTSIFFGAVVFVSYAAAVIWDIVGGCCATKTQKT